MEIFFRELRLLYGAHFAGRSADLPELPVQYADYAVWQREWLQGEELERQLVYWRGQLEGMETLRLPADRARPALPTYRGSREFVRIEEPIASGLKRLAREENITLFMILLAVFQLLLSRYSGQEDIAVGTLTAGRNRVETEGLIGFFVNTLVLRTDLGGNPTFRQLLQRVRDTALAAYSHAELPFEKLVEQLQPQRDLSRNPLVQVTFQMYPAPEERFEEAPRQLRTNRGIATFDLALDMWESRGALEGRLEYSADLFDGETISQFLRHFRNLTEAVAEYPGQVATILPMLDALDTPIIRSCERNYPRHAGLHHIFEAQAADTPDALALATTDGARWTYDELNRAANRIARGLAQRGAAPGRVIGFLAERSFRTIALVLGILKSGAAYLPLDPACPQRRREFMLGDSAALLVLPEDCIWINDESVDDSIVASGVTEHDLAYVLYTSGSSGQPKGVMVEHASLVNHAYACVERYELTASDRVLQFASLTFDVAAEEMFPTWAAGGTVVLAPTPTPSPENLARAAKDVTVMNLPAPYWHEWVDTVGSLSFPPHLRLMITGSDRVDEGRLERWLNTAQKRIRLVHAYGVTEATVTSLAGDITRENWTKGDPISLGRPLGNTGACVLDPSMQPVPSGAEGTLYLSGRGLARGYVHGDDSRFLDSAVVNGRLFNTGDRVRILREGDIVFVGRTDQQIKVRGFRVETGEIESALLKYPGIREAAAGLDSAGCVGAWVVADVAPEFSKLNQFLRDVLPDYMIPRNVTRVASLPRTASGKHERSMLLALPALEQESEPSPPQHLSEDQRMVLNIWQEVLGSRRVGLDDNFFDLGGHSLLTLRVHSRLEARLGHGIPLMDLFRHPTVRTLAASLRNGRSAPSRDPFAAPQNKSRRHTNPIGREVKATP
jgi:amino acid adenylation domain-containing protein